jgi:hypothetical protein
MVIQSLDVKKETFRPRKDDEEILRLEVLYLSTIGAMMYLANCTQPNITFSVNILGRHNSAPTRRYWIGVKHVLSYLCGTFDM